MAAFSSTPNIIVLVGVPGTDPSIVLAISRLYHVPSHTDHVTAPHEMKMFLNYLLGSGKSTFATSLGRAGWLVVSSDELRSKKGEFALQLGIATKPPNLAKRKVVVDRCSVDPTERRILLDLMHSPTPGSIHAVYFDRPLEDCKVSVCNRKEHPTIGQRMGTLRMRRVVDSFAKRLSLPTISEGFGRIEVVHSHEEGEVYLRSLGVAPIVVKDASVWLVKFPRTTHLLDPGGHAVSRDDLVMNRADACEWLRGAVVNVEEKIDGANLGLSLTESYSPRFQNRGHFVNSESATQWKGLDRWWKLHGPVLCTILEPGRHVLFGEWLALKHSIHYTALPSPFIAFDVYDVASGCFLSRQALEVFLEPTGIPIIRTIVRGSFASPDDLLPLLQTKSAYGARLDSATGEDGTVEGVYLRVDEGPYLQRRCKFVRPDFVQGITRHWSTMQAIKNIFRY